MSASQSAMSALQGETPRKGSTETLDLHKEHFDLEARRWKGMGFNNAFIGCCSLRTKNVTTSEANITDKSNEEWLKHTAILYVYTFLGVLWNTMALLLNRQA